MSNPRSPGLCPECGNPTDTTAKHCVHCAADLRQVRNQGETRESTESRSLKNRYRDSYSVANAIVRIGSTIKIVGLFAGILIFLAAFGFARSQPSSYRAGDAEAAVVIVGAIWGVLLWITAYVLGVLISALGQILKACLDGAVNGSPFLTNEQRATIMSL